jgi:hypothetical protein
VRPIVTDEAGTISESIVKYLSHVPKKHDFKELQKTAILVTAPILRKTVRQKYIFNMASNSASTINCNYRKAATIHTLEIWFAS